jgi:hypothetical protein
MECDKTYAKSIDDTNAAEVINTIIRNNPSVRFKPGIFDVLMGQ